MDAEKLRREGMTWLAQGRSEPRHSAALAQHKSLLKSGHRTMLRRRVWVFVLLAASTGGFMSGRSSRPALTRRFAAKKPRPGQRGSARAKERTESLEKEARRRRAAGSWGARCGAARRPGTRSDHRNNTVKPSCDGEPACRP